MAFRFGPSEVNFLLMLALFIFGMTNIFPSGISIYDNYIISPIEENVSPQGVFYPYIILLIVIFRILIVYLTFFDFYKMVKYGKKYHVFEK